MRDRETVMRGLDNAEAAQQLVDAYGEFIITFIPTKSSNRRDKLPQKKPGISLNLGENKIENLMRQERFLLIKSQLGAICI